MARATTIDSESDDSKGATTSAKQSKVKSKPETESQTDVASGEENGEEEGSEYEIEAIIDAKRGIYPGGRMGYLVKWKGYGEGDNSWVDEADAENAGDLVAEYWKKNPKGKPRKSTEPKRSRKSAAAESDVESASTKKRGRKSAAKASSDVENEKEDDRVTKKSRKSTTAASTGKKKGQEPDIEMLAPEEPQQLEEVVGDMKEYMDMSSWEELITTVDTVEREDNDHLTVYFTLTNGERAKVNSVLCAERFPRKLISFYEDNLRWRSAEDIDS